MVSALLYWYFYEFQKKQRIVSNCFINSSHTQSEQSSAISGPTFLNSLAFLVVIFFVPIHQFSIVCLYTGLYAALFLYFGFSCAEWPHPGSSIFVVETPL